MLLQDSVVHKIPTDVTKPTSGSQKSKARSSTPIQRGSPSRKVATGADKPPATPVAASPPSKVPAAPPRSHHLAQTLKLYTLLSNRTDLDHPLCAECTSVLIAALTKQLDETKRERDGYIAFEREVRNASGAGDVRQMEARIEELKVEEGDALEELAEAEQEKARLDRELEELEREEKELEEKEAEYAYSSCNFTISFNRSFTPGSGASITHTYSNNRQPPPSYAQSALPMRPTPLSLHVSLVPTCTTMRFAWGTMAYLELSMDCGLDVSLVLPYPGQRLMLLGVKLCCYFIPLLEKLVLYLNSKSHFLSGRSVELLTRIGTGSNPWDPALESSALEVTRRCMNCMYDPALTLGHSDLNFFLSRFGSGELHIGRLLHNRRFDYGMVAFLECLRQIIEFAKTQEETIEFPHACVPALLKLYYSCT